MGSLIWASGLIQLGHLHLGPLHHHVAQTLSPCQPTQAMEICLFLPLESLFQAEFTIFMVASTQGWGAHMGDSQISGTWTHSESNFLSLELKAIILALHHWVTVLRGHQVMTATDTTVVYYRLL